MNRPVLIAAALLAAAPVSAGVRIETVSRDIQTKASDGGPDVLLIQDGLLKETHAKSAYSITLIKQGIFYSLDERSKTYYVIDEAAVKKATDGAAAGLKEMQKRVKKMPPEQRAMMEKSMGDLMPGVFGKKHRYELNDAGKNETVEGRECHIWQLIKNGTLHEEYCVVPYATLPGKEDFAKAFRDLWDEFDAGTIGLASRSDYVDVRQSIHGYPVRIRSFDGGTQLRATEVVLTKWIEESMPASTFEIPAGYQKIDPPEIEQ